MTDTKGVPLLTLKVKVPAFEKYEWQLLAEGATGRQAAGSIMCI